ncbi:MAG TPA: hypothetical protein PK620_11455 [Denitromonas sp.]|nr:hypothetical protein [Denitromonas sp.]HQV15527.1 hypothetical protein [Denitromonas sp.]
MTPAEKHTVWRDQYSVGIRRGMTHEQASAHADDCTNLAVQATDATPTPEQHAALQRLKEYSK